MKRKHSIALLLTGVAFTGAMLGYLVAASDTPVAGTVVSTVFVAALGLISVFIAQKDEDGADNRSPQKVTAAIATLGWILTIFPPAFILGTAGGAYLRIRSPIRPAASQLVVPWGHNPAIAPTTPHDAWLWITFSKDASDLGLSPKDIQNVYEKFVAAPQTRPAFPVGPFSTQPAWPSHTRGAASPEKDDGRIIANDERAKPSSGAM